MNYLKIMLLALFCTQAALPFTDKEKKNIYEFMASEPSLWKDQQVKDVLNLLQKEENYVNEGKRATILRRWEDELNFRKAAIKAVSLKEVPDVIQETIRPFGKLLEQDLQPYDTIINKLGRAIFNWRDWDPLKTKQQKMPPRITPTQRIELEKIINAHDLAKEILALDKALANFEAIIALPNEEESIKAFTALELQHRPYFTQRSLKNAYEKALTATSNAVYGKRDASAREAEPQFKKLLIEDFAIVMKEIPLNPLQEKDLTQAQLAAKYSLSKASGAHAHLADLIIEKSKTLKMIQDLNIKTSPENKQLLEEAKNNIKKLNEELIKTREFLQTVYAKAPEKVREKEAAEARKEEDRARRAESREEIKKQRDEEERELKRKVTQRASEEKIKEIKKQQEEDEKEYAAQEKALAIREQEREKGEDLARRGQIAAEQASEL